VIDNAVWIDSLPSVAGVGYDLICGCAGEEQVRKVYASGTPGVERQVGLVQGTWWPT
jgi:hypothetical protein